MGYRTAGLIDARRGRDRPRRARRRRSRRSTAIEEHTIEASIIKVFGTEMLRFVADETLQIFGGDGYIADYPIERLCRDARINRIFEGTNEINRLIIPATLMKRIGQGRLPYCEFLGRSSREIAESRLRPPCRRWSARARDAAAEMAKRVIAYARAC